MSREIASHNRCRGSLSMLTIETYMFLFAHVDRKFWSSPWQIRY